MNSESEIHPAQSASAWWIISAALLGLAIASRVGMIAWPFINDAGLYAYMGKTVASGGILYRDFYETKLPGVGLIASVFWRAFGESWAGYVLTQLVMALLAAVILARAAWRHISQRAALPTFLFAIVFLNFAWTVYTGFQLETIQAFFETVAALAMLEALDSDQLIDALIAGLAAGFAAMVKPSGIGVGVAFAAALIVRRKDILRSAAHLGVFTCGALVPLLAALIYVVRAGIWAYLPKVMWQIERYADATPMGTIWPLKLAVVAILLVFPMSVSALLSRRDRKRESKADSPPPYVLCFVAAWFLVDLIGIMLQRRMYPYHFLPLVCPAALFYGMLPWRARPIPVALGLLPIALFSLKWEGTDLAHIGRGFRHEAVSEYVSAHTTSDDSVYADQIGRLLIETRRAPGSRYGTFFYFVNYDNAPQEYSQGLLNDFQERQPKYVLLNASRADAHREMAKGPILSLCPQRRENFLAAWNQIDAYMDSHYVLETVIDGTDVYRRRSPTEGLAVIGDK